jgi:hypothetical protein
MVDSLQKQCGDAVVTAIQALALTGIESNEIKLRKTFTNDKDGHVLKGISVCPVPERESPGTNQRDDYGYGFLIVMCQGTGHGNSQDIDKVSLWRQSTKRIFNNKRLSVTECYICTFEPADQFVLKKYMENKDVAMFVIRCWCREPRT